MTISVGHWRFKIKRSITWLPNNGHAIKSLARAVKLLVLKIQTNVLQLFHPGVHYDPEQIFWIDPKEVKFYTNYTDGRASPEPPEIVLQRRARQDFRQQVFDRNKDKGKLYGGDWDISDFRFGDLEIYKAIKLRINNGTDWQDTEFYKIIVTRINEGERVWASETEYEFKQHCEYIDRLILSIQENGFQLNSKIVIDGDDPNSLAKHKVYGSEVLVNIGRNGEYLFQDGRHRLAIAKLLGVDSIPVKVLVRHSEWHAKREQFLVEGDNSELENHPDLVSTKLDFKEKEARSN